MAEPKKKLPKETRTGQNQKKADDSAKDIDALKVASAYKIRSEHTTIHKTNYFDTIIHLIKANVGAGVFSMGQALSNGGILFGTLMVFVLGGICLYNMHILVDCSIHIQDIMNLDTVPNFPETIQICFACGPKCFRSMSKCVRETVRVFILCTQLGFCTAYTLFVANTVQEIMMHYIPSLPEESRLYILIVALPLIISVMITNLKYLSPVSLISNILLLTGAILVIYLCSADGYPPMTSRNLVASYAHWPLFFGTTMFAFEGIAVVIPLYNEMSNPPLFKKLYGPLNMGMLIVILFTNCVGFIAFWKFGDDVRSPVTLNFTKGILADIVMICVALGILLTYAIQFHVAVDITWWNIVGRFKIKKHVFLKELLYRVVVAIFTFIIAAIVPYLFLFLALIGSIFSTGLALLFPALSDISLRTNQNIKDRLRSSNNCSTFFRFSMDGVTLLFALIGMLTGAACSIYELYFAFRDKPHG